MPARHIFPRTKEWALGRQCVHVCAPWRLCVRVVLVYAPVRVYFTGQHAMYCFACVFVYSVYRSMRMSAQSHVRTECEESSSATTMLLTDGLAQALLGVHCYEKRRARTAKPGLETQTSPTVLPLCMCERVVFTQPTVFGREWWAAGVVQLLSGLTEG